MSTELGPLARGAAFTVAAAGFTAVVAGAQEADMVIFRDALTGAIPLLFVGAGAAAIVVGVKLAYPRGWARLAVVPLLAVLACGGAPWSLWLMWNGLFTALSVLAPAFAALAAVLVAVAWRDVGRVAAHRAAAEAETERLVREALAGEAPSAAERPWLLPTLYTLVGVPVGLFALAIFAPETFTWGEVRVRGLLAGRNPFASTFVANAKTFPYAGSPLGWYLDYEGQWVDLPKDDILAVADDIADEVAWQLAAATGTPDPVEGERILWAEGRQEELPLWIARSLRARNVFYSPESLFSRSFDPDVHVLPDTVHLDCDQLVYLYLHVAWRLDLAMAAVPSPMHLYLRYGGPGGEAPLYVEAIRFRHVDVNGERVDYLGQGLGEDYFIDADYYPSGRGGSWASAAVVDAAGLYAPWTERQIRDSIVANVMLGLERTHPDLPYAEEHEKRLEGTRDMTLVSNYYAHLMEKAHAAHEAGKFAQEIMTVSVPQGKADPIAVSRDESVRADTTAEKLGKLKPAFGAEGLITAGNAPGVNDGAAALVLMSEEKAQELGLKPLAAIVGHAMV
ncbi:MAG: hypothetical protein ACK4YP_03325, partial [Myxococcota bacterium]